MSGSFEIASAGDGDRQHDSPVGWLAREQPIDSGRFAVFLTNLGDNPATFVVSRFSFSSPLSCRKQNKQVNTDDWCQRCGDGCVCTRRRQPPHSAIAVGVTVWRQHAPQATDRLERTDSVIAAARDSTPRKAKVAIDR